MRGRRYHRVLQQSCEMCNDDMFRINLITRRTPVRGVIKIAYEWVRMLTVVPPVIYNSDYSPRRGATVVRPAERGKLMINVYG